jgi:hypothetical protein
VSFVSWMGSLDVMTDETCPLLPITLYRPLSIFANIEVFFFCSLIFVLVAIGV